jgi:signal transduction histidine kinase
MAKNRPAESSMTTLVKPDVEALSESTSREQERELLSARNELAQANKTLRDLNEQLGMTNRWLDGLNRELRAFYDTLPVGIFRAEASGRIVQASRRFSALLQIDTPDKWLTSVAENHRAEAERTLQQAIIAGTPFSHRFPLMAVTDPVRHIEMKAAPLSGQTAELQAFVGVIEDVTEQVLAEAHKRQIDRQAAVSQMTGGLAHNLNNLLTVIMGNLELLGDQMPDRPALHAILGAGLSASERAAKVINRLLVYSGHSATRRDRIDVDTALRQIAPGLARSIEPHHRLICDLKAEGTVELDIQMLREALEELTANATAAMPAGGDVLLSTRIEPVPSGAVKVVISIRDQGLGMDEPTLTKAREPFFTTHDVGQGIGLGLSLVDGVARIGGGHLKLHSQLGAGTMVEMHLPAVRNAGLSPAVRF